MKIMSFNDFISEYAGVISWVAGGLVFTAVIYALIEVIKPVIDFFRKL